MRVLLLVTAPVADGCLALRVAETLAVRGDDVHVVGTRTPIGFRPTAGVTVWPAPDGLVPSGRTGEGMPGTSVLRPASALAVGLRRGLRSRRERVTPFVAAWARRAHPAATAREVDVVHAVGLDALALGHRVAAERGVPLVYHCDAGPADRAGRGVRAERRLGADARAVVAATHAVADDLEREHGWTAVRVVRGTCRPLVTMKDPPAPRRLLHAGPLAGGTDLETVVAAAGALDLAVDLVGPQVPDAAPLDPGAAHVWPAVAPAEVAPLLRSAGIGLVPAPVSGTGTVSDTLYRAVAAGVPVVAADVGETATTVRGYRLGTLYRPGDPGSLVEAVRDVVRRYPDHVRRVRAAQRSLSWGADETVLLDVYAGLRPPTVVVELPVTEGTHLR